MLSQNDLTNIKKLLQPIQEDIVDTNKKLSKIDAQQAKMSTHLNSVARKMDYMEKKIGTAEKKIDKGFKHLDERIDVLDGKADHVLKYAEIIEVEHEKRLKKVESKIGIAP